MDELKIIKAIYYDPDIGIEQGTDVTAELSSEIINGNLIYNGVYNNIFPDYFKRKRKKLKIEIEYKGKKFTKFYNENEKINLPSDLGMKNEKVGLKNFLTKHLLGVIIFVIAIILIVVFGWKFKPELNTLFGKIVPPNENQQIEKISSFILYHEGDDSKIEIVNRGTQDIYLYGTQFNNEKSTVDKEKRIIPSGMSYYLNCDSLEEWIKVNIGENGEQHVSFNIFLTDINQKKYIMKNILYIRVLNGNITIQPQMLSLENTNW